MLDLLCYVMFAFFLVFVIFLIKLLCIMYVCMYVFLHAEINFIYWRVVKLERKLQTLRDCLLNLRREYDLSLIHI